MLQLDGIDWHAPWLVPLRAVGQAVQQRVLVGCLVADALNSVGACPVGFVRQAELPPGQAYEQYIFDTGQVPTRENLHDFFNGLVWLQFPHTKRRLNPTGPGHCRRWCAGRARAAA